MNYNFSIANLQIKVICIGNLFFKSQKVKLFTSKLFRYKINESYEK